jgi:DNA gyrase subunit A
MARMAQDFSLRYTLVDGQGNFGSIDGDSPAAMRYTEARLERRADSLLADIDMDTVEWQPNFDDSLQEPTVLPGMLPNFLVNGTSGIAVGMATNAPPHNLSEVADAIVFVIDNWDRHDSIAMEELMAFVKGPDFPTGAIILGTEGIKQAFGTGRGKIIVRSRTIIEEMKNNRFRIIVTEIPYQVNKSTLIERIAELVRDGKLEHISDLRDESDRRGMRIVIELSRGAAPKKVRNRLFKHTALQNSFSINMLALVNGEPTTLPLRRSIIVYIEHRQEVITRRTQFQLAKARERAHILEGYRIALLNLDAVIATIRESENAETARVALMDQFGLSQVQAQAILDLQLRRLAGLERQRIEDEYQEILGKIAYYLELLADPAKVRGLIREDMLALKQKFGDARRTAIEGETVGEFTDEDLIGQTNVLVSYSAGAYIKRLPADTFRSQARGGKGMKGGTLRTDDEIVDIVFARTLDTMLFFTDMGRVYTSRVYDIPEGSRTSKGAHIANVLNLQTDESVTTMLVVPNFDAAQYITVLTRQGMIKRMDLGVFANVRQSGIIAMTLDPGDSLDWARLTNGQQDFILVTHGGKSLRFNENLVRPMGRGAMGVKAIRLLPGDNAISFDVVQPDSDMLVILEQGWGKRVNVDEYISHGRNTQGNWTIDHTRLDETGPIVAARVVHPEDHITVMTTKGKVIRMEVKDISQYGRQARGVRTVRLDEGDTVASFAVLSHEDLTRGVDAAGGSHDETIAVVDENDLGEGPESEVEFEPLIEDHAAESTDTF